MNATDTQEFFDAWDQCAELYGKEVSPNAKELAFKLLVNFSLNQVKAGLKAHMLEPENGQFMPKPADVVRHIQHNMSNQFIGAEEAWATFPRDESLSACVTQQALAAFAVSNGLDEVSGRMAFKEAYNRVVEAAKRKGESPEYFITQGSDKQSRDEATLDALCNGLITSSYAFTLLPHIERDDILALENKSTTTNAVIEKTATKLIGMTELMEKAEEVASPESAKKHLNEINKILGSSAA